jgi:hypothetical protein
MFDQTDELIKEIAVKHGIAVSRDDPIMILQTINNRLLQDTERAQQALLDTYKEELEALSVRWSEDVKDKSQRIVNASLSASKNAMAESVQESAKTASTLLKTELEIVLIPIRKSIKEARMIGILNIAASVITLTALAIVLLFRH